MFRPYLLKFFRFIFLVTCHHYVSIFIFGTAKIWWNVKAYVLSSGIYIHLQLHNLKLHCISIFKLYIITKYFINVYVLQKTVLWLIYDWVNKMDVNNHPV
jgi:hypothetical protein